MAFGCASEALSLGPPNIVQVTPQPSIVSIGERTTIVFYPQSALPEGEAEPTRFLDTGPLEDIGMAIEEWNFLSAFDFSVTLAVTERANKGTFEIELPIENEFQQFIARFSLQVINQ